MFYLFLVLLSVFTSAHSLVTCQAGELRCQNGLQCVPRGEVCDGKKDCENGLDEHDLICATRFGPGACARSRQKGVFACQFFGCIPISRVCDGAVNCLDGSDESLQTCEANSCLPGQFRCRYGACIPDSQMCNGHVNCADGSDESIEVCQNIKCKRNEFQCRYGACIPSAKMCNGRKDCYYDGSDESSELCLITRAKWAVKLEEEQRRLEAEDEERRQKLETENKANQFTTRAPIVTTTTVRSTTISEIPETSYDSDSFEMENECPLPDIPENADAILNTCLSNPDAYFCVNNTTVVPQGTLIQFQCSPGFVMLGNMYITCNGDGNWSNEPPICEPLLDVRFGIGTLIPRDFKPYCPAIKPESSGLMVECIEKKTLEVHDCNKRQKPGTEVRFSCKKYYRPSGDLPVHYEKCDSKGQWSPGVYKDFNCVPDCGISEVPKTPYILHGMSTHRGQWPWHVAIYVIDKNGEENYICGGSLITERSVLTSAHCVGLHGGARNASSLVLYLGKQTIEVPDADPVVQKRNVKKIMIEESFNPISLESDIAILALDSPAVLSSYVRTVCYPQQRNSFLEEYQLAEKNKGTVVGWGFTENGTLATRLRTTELPIVSATDCAESFRDFFASMTRSTVYCAGYLNGTALCNGDSGGGQYFKAIVKGTSRWYIQGLVSYGVPESNDPKKCASAQYAVFTRVGRYADWIVRTLSRENLF